MEKTNWRATGNTTKSTMNVVSVCTIRSSPYTCVIRQLTALCTVTVLYKTVIVLCKTVTALQIRQ